MCRIDFVQVLRDRIHSLLWELQFFSSQHATLRKLSLGTVNQFIVSLPTVSLTSFPASFSAVPFQEDIVRRIFAFDLNL